MAGPEPRDLRNDMTTALAAQLVADGASFVVPPGLVWGPFWTLSLISLVRGKNIHHGKLHVIEINVHFACSVEYNIWNVLLWPVCAKRMRRAEVVQQVPPGSS